MDKNTLRQTIRQRKRQFSRQQLRELSHAVIGRLTANRRFCLAKTLLLYSSLPDEVDTDTLLRSLPGRKIILPKVTGDADMELRIYTGPHDMATGSYGISEPTGPAFTALGEIDVAVIPGMAFDRHGNRLGRGRGYYDRLLPLMAGTYKIGLCFDFQMMENLPCEPHDIAVDEVIC